MSRRTLLGSLGTPVMVVAAVAGLILGFVFFAGGRPQLTFFSSDPVSCQVSSSEQPAIPPSGQNQSLLRDAILHYATSRDVPQQSWQEITVTLNVIKQFQRPLNMLIFGLGLDSLMWASLNSPGKTVFLEEGEEWIQKILSKTSYLEAYHVPYRTKLLEATELLSSYKSEPSCSPGKAYLKGNLRCKLALEALPDLVYETEWDLIMIDAPRGYFPEAPGRMGAIFSAAVMARGRKESNVTHVFLHDVDRPVEKSFAEEFLCKKYLVNSAGRLWHFEIPSVQLTGKDSGSTFC